MRITASDINELSAALPLALELEPYRIPLSPLAVAVASGESRRTIEKTRDSVLPDVWDEPLRRAALAGLASLRAEVERKLSVLAWAAADLDQPPRRSRFARAVVDCVLTDIFEHQEANMAALEQLERELAALPPDERPGRAAFAARGAYVDAHIPLNELRAAVVRAGRAIADDMQDDAAAERAARQVARSLATDERREAARNWARRLADCSSEHVPLLADELRALARESEGSDAGSDPIWVQACLGLTFELGLALS